MKNSQLVLLVFVLVFVNVHFSGLANPELPVHGQLADFVGERIALIDDPPVAICQDITVSANDSCIAIINPVEIDDGSWDPDADSLIFSLTPEGPFGIGDHDVVLTVTDTTGLFSQCSAIITVVDDSIPLVVTQSLTVILNSNGMAAITPADIDAGSMDNCGIDTMALDSYDFSCSDIGENLVTLTVTDFSGNSSSATDTVTVRDTISPSITVIEDIYELWPSNHKYEVFSIDDFVISVWDNCPISEDQVHIFHATSDEEENGNGDGDTTDDIVISDDCHSISLRKERQGGNNGRVYTVYFAVTDGNGQSDTAKCFVHVPHNQGSVPVDDGPEYSVYSECDTYTGIPGESDLLDKNTLQMSTYPNPFDLSVTVELVTMEIQQISVEIYNMKGELVHVLFAGTLLPGNHEFPWDGNGIDGRPGPKGVYLVKLVGSEKTIVNRIVKM